MLRPQAAHAVDEVVEQRIAAGGVAPSLARIAAARPDESVVAWVFFRDRSGAERDATVGRARMSRRALERRMRRGVVTGVTAADLPVHEEYVRALVQRGAAVRGTSRWLNAASVEIPAGLASTLARLPFVTGVELVPRGQPIRPVGDAEVVPGASVAPRSGVFGNAPDQTMAAPGDQAYYGGSWKQLAMMQVPQLHAMGLSGAGVLVCMLDSGFRLTHEAFAGLDVLATRDFIHRDTNVDTDPAQDQPDQTVHGTWTLACVAGSRPGTYSGAAFGATVALAKTEDIATERPVEMDYWQFGVEWADSMGADIVSSSLGYSEFDEGYPSYTYADMDGRTTVVARAAIEAARRGIVVVNSAGNSGAQAWRYIISPGDADSIITAGAVDSFNVVTQFSSRGPTSDGRIKPDVSAMGSAVLVPEFGATTGYRRMSGTSFSCPLTAGVAALLLEAHPNWGPFELREALRETALNHASPNNDIGWGLVQGLAARNWVPSTTGVPLAGGASLALAARPNPLRTGGELEIRFATPAAARVTIEIVDLAGRRRARVHDAVSAGPSVARWNGREDRGGRVPAGVYWVRLAAHAGGSVESRAMRVVVVR